MIPDAFYLPRIQPVLATCVTESAGVWVRYKYIVSILIMTFERESDRTWVPEGQSRVVAGLPYFMISLLFGWWGFPWGFLATPVALIQCLSGGRVDGEAVSYGSPSPMAAVPVRDALECPQCWSEEFVFQYGRHRCLECGSEYD